MVNDPDITNDFSGEAGAVLQTGTVHGDINVHHSRRSFPPPHQLPMSPSGFVNRHVDLEELDRLLEYADSERVRSTTGVVSAVSGAPGVGKTALVLHWAHRVRSRFPDGDLFIDLQGYGPGRALSAEQALDVFLRALDIPSQSIPDSLSERAALFRSLLDRKRVLVVIDNASSSKQVRHLLPASRECISVVTSRSTLPSLVAREGAIRVSLDILSPEDSVQLLAEFLGLARIAAEPSMAARIAELCGNLPLALRVVAERAAGRPYLSLAELVQELVGEQNRLDAMTSTEDELSDTRAIFSWSYRALPAELQRTFRLLGLHAGEDISVPAAAALLGIRVAAARRQLRALLDVHLIQEKSANRFHLHDLLRAYSMEQVLAEETQEERTQAIRRMLTWYLFTADAGRRAILPYSAAVPLVPVGEIEMAGDFDSGSAAIHWFDVERRNLLAAVRQASELGQFDITWKLAIVTSGYYELRSYWSDWEKTVRVGLTAARALGDPLGEAVSLTILGDADWRSGRLAEATERYQRAADIGHELSIGWLEGFALRGLGLVYEERNDFDTAVEFFESALGVFQSSGFRRGEGMSLLSLGKCARALGDLSEAISYGTAAVEIFEEIEDMWTVAWGELSLAASVVDAGGKTDASLHLSHAIGIFKEFHDQRGQAQALVSLGELLRDSGELGKARDCWNQAAELYEILGDHHAAQLRERIEELGSAP